MKKLISTVLALVLTVVSLGFVNEASAAPYENSSVGLSTSETSDTTSRITANGIGRWNVVNTGNYNVSFRVFKNGVALFNGAYTTVAPGASNGTSFSTTPDAGYSLRIYCKSSSGIGCQASRVITNYQ